jgi:alpha/beta superfamily hydrolase
MKTGVIEKITFPSGSLKIEGLLVRGKIPKGVVISHPHPLYGGDMHNHVVDLINRAFEEKGWSTLRFNFRGTERSQGDFDNGRGEQEDVLAAVAYLKGLINQSVVLAGYSFGAWVNAQAALNNSDVGSSILVSPPLAMMEFSFLKIDTKTALMVVGDRDEFCPVPPLHHLVREMKISPPVKIIPGADHFFSSGSEELISAIKEIEPLL